ncbi:hypothetical protein AB0M00_43860 [Streptomyces chartreusis]|uniref:hypothetical protein n=1 Tax=Streptomyces chartreusis TaxID=1969 RepID=UPI003427EE45
MAKPIAAGSDVQFVKALRTGTVHLVILPPESDVDDESIESIPMDGSGRALAGLLGTPTVTRCGQNTFPHNPSADARHGLTYRFHDEQLCVACYRTLAPADQHLAFEHAQPDDASV